MLLISYAKILYKSWFHRRGAVEPLIGHVKKFELRKSKTKSDNATFAFGYLLVLGFNFHLRQMRKHLVKRKTA